MIVSFVYVGTCRHMHVIYLINYYLGNIFNTSTALLQYSKISPRLCRFDCDVLQLSYA